MEVKSRPYTELADIYLPETVNKDFGNGARLLSWESEYFTQVGDNYLGKIKCVTCKILHQGNKVEVKYVVKFNPRRPLEIFRRLTNSFFIKEGKFLSEVVPQLNNVLEKINNSPLNVPRCVNVSLNKNEEFLVMEDLRQNGHLMFDRLTPMDEEHLSIVMEELAKQHAASYILHLQTDKDKGDLSVMFPYMKDLWLNEENPDAFQFISYCKMRFASAIYALEREDGFSEVVYWLKKHERNLFQFYVKDFESTIDRFKVICHGDCWTNNMMFRYDEKGKPNKVILIDYQQCRIASLMIDITVCLVTNTNGDLRKKFIDNLLRIYYLTFTSIFKSSGRDALFTFDELKDEYENKIRFGCLYGIIKIPVSLADCNETINLNSMDEKVYKELLEEGNKKFHKVIRTNQSLRQRFLSLFDEALEYKKFN